jgi:hypothetical protein
MNIKGIYLIFYFLIKFILKKALAGMLILKWLKL